MRLLSLSVLASAAVVLAGNATFGQNAICTCDQMMRYYETENAGLWGSSWWQSGILMQSLAEMRLLDPSWGANYDWVFANTYARAPAYSSYTGFVNDYNDDEGWWANAFVAVYDLTGDPKYLDLAVSLFHDISSNPSSCGGMLWNKKGVYTASIANELYIYLAASLASRDTANRTTYLAAAESTWVWLWASGVITGDSLVKDGVNGTTCAPIGTKFSYNQGVILSAAVELYKATDNFLYLQLVSNIANAVVAPGSPFTSIDGIIRDCEVSCDSQSKMFKGPLFRGIRALQQAYPHDSWKNWLVTNAKAVWDNALYVDSVGCHTGADYNGPVGDYDEITQGAALDALMAAWAVSE